MSLGRARMEIRFSFGHAVLSRLPTDERGALDLDEAVDLHSYRLSRLGETNVELVKNEPGKVRGPVAVGTRQATDDEAPLHEIIDIINERFGTDFTLADRLLFEQVVEDGKADEHVQARAKANTYENFAISIQDKVMGLMLDRMNKNKSIVTKFLNEEDFQRFLADYLTRRIYDDARGERGTG